MDNPDPLENRSAAIKALYHDYGQRVEKSKKCARCFLIVNFLLLVLALFAVIYAPHLAIDDVRIYRQKLIDIDEEKLEEIDNQIAELRAGKSSDMVASSDRPNMENKLKQLKNEKGKIAKSLNDLKKSQRESILGTPDSNSGDFPTVLFQMDFLRIGLLTVLILISQHVIKLARYNFRLATFYRAHQDILLMTKDGALPWPTLTPIELEQAANALSPDHVDPELSSKTLMEMLRHRHHGE